MLGASLVLCGAAAAQTSPGVSVPGVRAGSACLTEQVRITGFATPREEGGATLGLDGYRITEILVAEGDKVTANQDLLRAARLDEGGPPNPVAAQRPPTLTLRAPIAGRIVRINARVGMLTGPGAPNPATGMPDPQVRIAAETGMDLLVDVPSPYAPKIRSGSAARILRDDGDEVKGTVRVPVSEVDPGTQLGRARIAVEPPSALRAGQFASAVIETARDCGLSVPRSAVTYQNGGASVQVFNGSAVETRSVRTGLFDETTIRIREGLTDGEPVVANAGTVFRPGDRVTPVISTRTDGPKDGSR
jgi:multidrug efflux pump subunit AcrA (membrane-fusion protein)